jgi:hypothetical protein
MKRVGVGSDQGGGELGAEAAHRSWWRRSSVGGERLMDR